jgi:hypothetical protein
MSSAHFSSFHFSVIASLPLDFYAHRKAQNPHERTAAGCGALGGLFASNGCGSKRDLDGSFNQIRIADLPGEAMAERVRSSRRPAFSAGG